MPWVPYFNVSKVKVKVNLKELVDVVPEFSRLNNVVRVEPRA